MQHHQFLHLQLVLHHQSPQMEFSNATRTTLEISNATRRALEFSNATRATLEFSNATRRTLEFSWSLCIEISVMLLAHVWRTA